MIQLLPGDRLWNRYQVDSIIADAAIGGAWLTPLSPLPEAGRFLLLPVTSTFHDRGSSESPSAPSALGELLRLAGVAWRGRQKQGGADLPLLGCVEWIGSLASGGVAIVPAPPSRPLPEFMQAIQAQSNGRGLAPEQMLPLFAQFVDSLSAFFNALELQDRQAEQLRRALIRVLTPGGLALRTGRAELALRADAGSTAPAFQPPPWADFTAPELYRGGVAGERQLIFSLARMACHLLGMGGSKRRAPEEEWSALAAWASGQRDALEEFRADPVAAGLPSPLRIMLAGCLDLRSALPASGSLEKLSLYASVMARGFMKSRPSGFALAACESCGFLCRAGETGSACPCCGTSRLSPKDRAELPKRAPAGTPAPTVGTDPGMTLILAGTFLSGEDKVPRSLRAFAIDTTPVTEGAYKRFLAEAGKTPRAGAAGSRAAEFDNHPVTRVTWYEAAEFAEHYGKRLPTIFEWEKAARGSDGRKFPFGNEYKSGHGRQRASDEAGRKAAGTENVEGAEKAEGGTVAVGSFPEGASPYGVLDMAGNVLEWTSSARRAGERLCRAVKGSCYIDGSSELARCTSVQYVPPESNHPHIGFRCVKDVD